MAIPHKWGGEPDGRGSIRHGRLRNVCPLLWRAFRPSFVANRSGTIDTCSDRGQFLFAARAIGVGRLSQPARERIAEAIELDRTLQIECDR